MILFRFRKNKLAVISVFFLIFIAIVILSAPLYIDYDKAITMNTAEAFQSPSWNIRLEPTSMAGTCLHE